VLTLTPTLSLTLTLTLFLTVNPKPTNPKLHAHIPAGPFGSLSVQLTQEFQGGKKFVVRITDDLSFGP